MTEITLYNTRTRAKERFAPIDPTNVRMYVCGPTVYDRAHIGNARPVVVFDVLFRLLRHVYGPDHVTYVRNVTDVDDKINARAAAEKRPIRELTDETLAAYHADMGALGVLPPTHEPRATDYIPQMVAMIETLIARGHAYAAEGHVLFSVASFPDYGRFAKRSLDEMQAGARVEVAPYKRDPMDFVLWKPSNSAEPGWPSPWGHGRPGWHIECSAMSEALLGTSFDIHGGGIDLVFPHHENEIAQSRCAHPDAGFALYWLHNGFLNVEGEKMSKSLGNFFTVRDLLDEYARNFGIENFGPAIRLRLMMGHYRSPIDASRSFLEEAAAKLDVYRHTLHGWNRLIDPGAFLAAINASGVVQALSDDLNTPKAVAILDQLVAETRKQLVPAAGQGPTPLMPSNWTESPTAFDRLGCALAFLGFTIADLSNFNANARADAFRRQVLRTNVGARIEALLAERSAARKARDFARADALRDGLIAAGVAVKDTPKGVEWDVGPDFDPTRLEALAWTRPIPVNAEPVAPVTRERLTLYDTTLRDGQQSQGVDFSVEDKLKITAALDALGIDYVEGGWPGANPTDSGFFEAAPRLGHARLAAFGMTKRSGRSASNDEVLAAVVNAGTPVVCLVGKTHVFHVETALGIPLEENVENIATSIRFLKAKGREAILDAEHFFDGYKADPEYALSCLKAALDAGARWVVLCDTNGGTLPAEVGRITAEVVAAGVPGEKLGIHTHDDTGNAVANSLAAVDAGARQVQGTLNGLGERCGNANLVTLIPTLLLKEPYASRFEIGVSRDGLAGLTRTSRLLDDILNRVPDRAAPYVGASAFTHKAGLHASAILKDPTTYEHVPPEVVGNARVIPMSNQAGQSNLRERLARAGIEVPPGDPRLARILAEVKEREDRGFAYDGASASFEILARRHLGLMPRFFEVERYRVTVERRVNGNGEMVTASEAVVVARFGSERVMNVSESHDPLTHADQGPVNALSRALAKDLGPYQGYIEDMKLADFRVRITSGGTEAVTRVLIESMDGQGRRWSTVGVSANIVDASFQALQDAILWKLLRDGAPVAGAA